MAAGRFWLSSEAWSFTCTRHLSYKGAFRSSRRFLKIMISAEQEIIIQALGKRFLVVKQ